LPPYFAIMPNWRRRACSTFRTECRQTATGLIDSFFGQLAGWARSTPRWSGSGLTRLVVELADLPGHPARPIAQGAKATTEAWLTERLREAKVAGSPARARDVMLLMEGAMMLVLIHGDISYMEAAASAAKRLVRKRG
jgi:hypothetical protein